MLEKPTAQCTFKKRYISIQKLKNSALNNFKNSQLVGARKTNHTVGCSEDEPGGSHAFDDDDYGADDEFDHCEDNDVENLSPMSVPPQLNFGWSVLLASRLPGVGGLKSGRFEPPTKEH